MKRVTKFNSSELRFHNKMVQSMLLFYQNIINKIKNPLQKVTKYILTKKTKLEKETNIIQ